jgi:hypothetical protein
VPNGTTVATGWYRKGEVAASAAEIERMALPAYHELIKVTIDADEFGSLRAMLRYIAAHVPWLAAAFRRFKPAPLPPPSLAPPTCKTWPRIRARRISDYPLRRCSSTAVVVTQKREQQKQVTGT